MSDHIDLDRQWFSIQKALSNADDTIMRRSREAFFNSKRGKNREEILQEIAELQKYIKRITEKHGKVDGESLGHAWRLAVLQGILDEKPE